MFQKSGEDASHAISIYHALQRCHSRVTLHRTIFEMTFNPDTEQGRRTTSSVLTEHAALAPEVASLGASEWRGDNAAPEVRIRYPRVGREHD